MKTIQEYVVSKREESLEFLKTLIEAPSKDLQETLAQDYIFELMKELNLEIDKFNTDSEYLKDLEDYCPNAMPFHKEAYNLIGYTPYDKHKQSLLLFAHIDTESHEIIAYKRDDKRVYGLGAADDKSGIAAIFLALKYYKEFYNELPYNVIVMSCLGKRGGVGGTLIGCDRLKYNPDAGIYLHPAETGLGLNEIKNISLGVIDFKLSTEGQLGRAHYDLDYGISANNKLIVLANALVELANKRYLKYGNQDEHGTKLNIGVMQGGSYIGKVSKTASLEFRVHFGKNQTIQDIENEVEEALNAVVENNPSLFKDHTYSLEKGYLRAGFAMMDRNHPLIELLKNKISTHIKTDNFIYQAHGASDIRLPMILGNTPTVGLGSLCYLPIDSNKHEEWVDIEEFEASIKVLIEVLTDWIK